MTFTNTDQEKAKEWWLKHIGEMAEHYRRLYERHETRARYVLAILGIFMASAKFSIDLSGAALHWVSISLIMVFFIVSFFCIFLLLNVMTPLRGFRFFSGSLIERIHSAVVSGGNRFPRLRSFLGWGDFSELAPYPLSRKFTTAASKYGSTSIAARRVLVEYLQREFRTDLSWWLNHSENCLRRDVDYDVRRRQVFWYWANKEAANRKGIVLEFTMSILTSMSLMLIPLIFLAELFSFIIQLISGAPNMISLLHRCELLT